MTKPVKLPDDVLKGLISLDGKPLDFSFKNIKNINGFI